MGGKERKESATNGDDAGRGGPTGAFDATRRVCAASATSVSRAGRLVCLTRSQQPSTPNGLLPC